MFRVFSREDRDYQDYLRSIKCKLKDKKKVIESLHKTIPIRADDGQYATQACYPACREIGVLYPYGNIMYTTYI